MIKRGFKRMLGLFKTVLNGVKAGRNVYVGFNGKIINRGMMTLGDNVSLRGGRFYTAHGASRLLIDSGSDIGEYSTVSAQNLIRIGKNVLSGTHVFISDHNHEYIDVNVPIMFQGVRCGKDDRVEIGDGTWIGTNAVIAGNVRIGKNCVIGANSVVTRDIPDYCVAAGAPCRIIKQYDQENKKWKKIRN
ncbi:MAG: acyltransferase [Tannerella sp.]|jgi:acetyltransferase-like isoleucine patch superfamily enzyme|nr:acyltransferase [Tannerella sp.]